MLALTISTAAPFAKLALMVLGVGTMAHLSITGLAALLKKPGLSQDTWRVVLAVAEKAVMAVEQAHGNLSGEDKKRLAEQLIGQILSHMGLKIPQALIDAAIESSVLLLKAIIGITGDPQTTPAPPSGPESEGKAAA